MIDKFQGDYFEEETTVCRNCRIPKDIFNPKLDLTNSKGLWTFFGYIRVASPLTSWDIKRDGHESSRDFNIVCCP